MLDNHKLSLQLSKRRAPGATPAAGAKGGAAAQQGGAAGSGAGLGKTGKTEGGATAKLVVRNVAFEATRKVGPCAMPICLRAWCVQACGCCV